MNRLKKDGSPSNKPSKKIKGIAIHLTIDDILPKQAENELPKN